MLHILRNRVALGAFHDAAERFDPPKCYPQTREAILNKIMAWIEQRPENLDLFSCGFTVLQEQGNPRSLKPSQSYVWKRNY